MPDYPVVLYPYNDNYVDVKYPFILFRILLFKLVSVINNDVGKFHVQTLAVFIVNVDVNVDPKTIVTDDELPTLNYVPVRLPIALT